MPKCYLEFLDKKFVKKNFLHILITEKYVKLYDKNFFLNQNNHYSKIYSKISKFTKKIKKY